MEIQVIDWLPDLFKQSDTVLGKVKVLLNKKMFVWMTVIKGKKSNFAKFPSFKHKDVYQPVLGWIDKDEMEREISSEVIKQLVKENLI
jgi:hypothetical protein